MKSKVTIKKYMGDDIYSWAVFVDGNGPVIAGLSHSEAKYHKKSVQEILARRAAVISNVATPR